jgi:hypothetical protein
MATLGNPDQAGSVQETAAAKSEHLAAEAEMISEARADLAAGRVINDPDLDAWLAGLLRGDPVELREDAPSARMP